VPRLSVGSFGAQRHRLLWLLLWLLLPLLARTVCCFPVRICLNKKLFKGQTPRAAQLAQILAQQKKQSRKMYGIDYFYY